MKSNLRYRVNFGNGQVYEVKGKREGFAYIASLTENQAFAFIEFQDPETKEWFSIGNRP